MKSIELQTIYVMWLRETKKFFRAKSRLFGTLAMPFFFLLALGFGFSPIGNLPGAQGVSYLDFLVPGIIGMSMLFSSMTGGLSVLWDKEFGFLKEMMVAPVKRWAIILGRIVGGLTTALIQGVLILIISIFMGFKILGPVNILLGILFMILISAGFIGFGVAIASVLEDTQGFSLIINFIIFPTFLLSGAFFPVSNFPPWLQKIAFLNPLTYGIDGLRTVLINFSQFSLLLDLTVLLSFDVLMIVLGSVLFSRSEV